MPPAMIDDPSKATIYRQSGPLPYPDPANPCLPEDVHMYQVTLRDRQTVATIVPFASHDQVPRSLLIYLSDQINKEIEGGDTYPMTETMSVDKFARYWFQNFGAIMLLGSIEDLGRDDPDRDWVKICLGSFYIKPNYPGRSSHVCNGGFLVTDRSRNRGVGRLMGEAYLEWAPRLGYSYSVFNLVYETNVVSCRIWDALGFKRIGRVKGCGNLKSYPGRYIDALIYGRNLVGPEAEELQSEDRFDKIRFYLKYGKYPPGADRAEKSRLRAASTHYRLADGDTLMHGDKEVVADPRRQLEIARRVHEENHAGINRTTTTIREKYHWRSIKDTATEAIKGCEKCVKSRKAAGVTVNVGVNGITAGPKTGGSLSPLTLEKERERDRARLRQREIDNEMAQEKPHKSPANSTPSSDNDPLGHDDLLNDPYGASMAMSQDAAAAAAAAAADNQLAQNLVAATSMVVPHPHDTLSHAATMLQDHHHHHHHHDAVYQPIDPQLMADHHHHHHHHQQHNPFDLEAHTHPDTDFQSLLNDPDDGDREMDMFVRQHDDVDDDEDINVPNGHEGGGGTMTGEHGIRRTGEGDDHDHDMDGAVEDALRANAQDIIIDGVGGGDASGQEKNKDDAKEDSMFDFVKDPG